MTQYLLYDQRNDSSCFIIKEKSLIFGKSESVQNLEDHQNVIIWSFCRCQFLFLETDKKQLLHNLFGEGNEIEINSSDTLKWL